MKGRPVCRPCAGPAALGSLHSVSDNSRQGSRWEGLCLDTPLLHCEVIMVRYAGRSLAIEQHTGLGPGLLNNIQDLVLAS